MMSRSGPHLRRLAQRSKSGRSRRPRFSAFVAARSREAGTSLYPNQTRTIVVGEEPPALSTEKRVRGTNQEAQQAAITTYPSWGSPPGRSTTPPISYRGALQRCAFTIHRTTAEVGLEMHGTALIPAGSFDQPNRKTRMKCWRQTGSTSRRVRRPESGSRRDDAGRQCRAVVNETRAAQGSR